MRLSKTKIPYTTYGAGLFANGQWDMLAVLVPLYAVLADLSAAEIGLLVAARSILPMFLSIHGGIIIGTPVKHLCAHRANVDYDVTLCMATVSSLAIQ
jgi:hypothetical protein